MESLFLKKLLICFMLICGVLTAAGCGSGSGSTSGTLTLSDLSGSETASGSGYYLIADTVANYTPESGTPLPNTDIKYEIYAASIKISSGTLYTDSNGNVTINAFTVAQDSQPISVVIKVTFGGLSVQKLFIVPALSTT